MTTKAQLQARLEAAEKERDFWKTERDRIKAFLSEGERQMIESEQTWKRRCKAAERVIAPFAKMARAIEGEPENRIISDQTLKLSKELPNYYLAMRDLRAAEDWMMEEGKMGEL